MPSKLRKKTLVYVLEWVQLFIVANAFVVNFCPSSHDLVTADVDRDVFFRCWSSSSSAYKRQGCDRKKRRQLHLKVTTSLCKGVCFATNNFCAWHWKYSTQTVEALLIFSEVLKFDLRKKFL